MDKLKLYLADIRTLDEKACLELISEQRCIRALAMQDGQQRLHCIAAGMLLKTVLGVSDEELVIGEHGKPEKKDGGVYFNISHGGDYAVLAVFGSAVGVDIEPIGDRVPEVPELIFTERELAWLRAKPTPTRFAVLWTRVESLLKAQGGGFELCSREHSVFDEGSPWRLTTQMHHGHVISCAAGDEFETELVEIKFN